MVRTFFWEWEFVGDKVGNFLSLSFRKERKINAWGFAQNSPLSSSCEAGFFFRNRQPSFRVCPSFRHFKYLQFKLCTSLHLHDLNFVLGYLEWALNFLRAISWSVRLVLHTTSWWDVFNFPFIPEKFIA